VCKSMELSSKAPPACASHSLLRGGIKPQPSSVPVDASSSVHGQIGGFTEMIGKVIFNLELHATNISNLKHDQPVRHLKNPVRTCSNAGLVLAF
jgi:hypothetical protein